MVQDLPYMNYAHLRCSDCGYERFLADAPMASAALYAQDADYRDDLAIAENPQDLLQWSHRHALKVIESTYSERDISILDIGCFNGFFVRALLDSGFEATGIDFNIGALEFGRNTYNLAGRISAQSIADLRAKGARFDVITLFEVLEHIEDCQAMMAEAVDLLKPNGLVIVSAPNSGMFWRPKLDYPPHHLSRFSPRALMCLVSNAGLTRIASHEQASSFDLIRMYVGTFFRNTGKPSMRGGEFRRAGLVNALRRVLNKSRQLAYAIFWPIDTLLHGVGFRFISQLTIAKKLP